jgi:lipid-binding SYLF domain-containing protein
VEGLTKDRSYSRSRGVVAGANLKGVVVRPEDDLNRAVYDQTAHELLSDGEEPPLRRTG